MKKLFLLVCLSLCFGYTGLFGQTTYTVGPGKTYTTFDAAITALNATNPLPVGGIIYNVDPSWTTTEDPRAIVLTAANNDATHPIIFQVNAGAVTPGIHAIIKPTNGTTTPNSPVTNNAGIEIVGGDYITFNGVDITINSGSTLKYGYYLRNNGAANGAQHNTIKNCTVKLSGSSNLNSIGVYQNTATAASGPGGANSYNTYDAVSVTTCYKGFVLNGTNSAANGDINCELVSCITGSGGAVGDIGSSGSVSTAKTVGIEAANQVGVSVHDCEVKNVGYNSSSAGVGYGIFLNNVYGTSSIYKNSIHDIVGLKNGTSDLIHGVDIKTANSASVVNMYNNFIYSIFSSGSSSGIPTVQLMGLYIDGVASSTVNIYFNSIYMGTPSSVTYSSLNLNYGSTAVYSNTVSLNLQNNIIKSNIVTGTRAHFLVYFAGGSLLTSDYNNYDCAANGSGTSGYFTGFKGSNIAAIGAWRTATGSDVNSKQMTTSFKSTIAGSIDLHLQFAGCTNDVNYKGVFINGAYPAITGLDSVDIDYNSTNTLKRGGSFIGFPYIGADEVDATADVTISPNQPLVGTVAKAETNQVLYSVIVTANNADAVFKSISVTSGSDNPPGYYQNSTQDFKNFKLWIDSINGTYNSTTSTQLGSAVTNAPTINGTFIFSAANLYTLTKCKTYYVFVTADIGSVTAPAAQSGDNINLNNTYSNFTFSNPVKTSSTTGASGYQYIVDKYFNFPQKDVNYSSTWYVPIPPYLTAADTIIYTGNFDENYHIFQMITNPVDSMETPWTITGTLSKLIVGHHLGASAVTFPVQQTYTGTADVWPLGTIKFKTATIPTTLGILWPNSTVYYDSAWDNTVITANYYNLTLGGARSGANNITLPNTTVGVAGAFIASATFGTGNYVHAGAASTITFNGTAVQTIPTFNFNILNINNTSGVSLNTTTGTGACVVNSGSTISVGAAASSFTVTTGNLFVNGTFKNSSTITNVFANTNLNLGFGATGIFNHIATNSGQIPPATWDAASNINVTGLTASGTGVTAGIPAGLGFGNITYDNPGGLTSGGAHKLFGSYTSPINIQGNLVLGRNNLAAGLPVQMTSGSQTINIGGSLYVYAGNYGMMTYASTTTMAVTGNIVIDATYAYPLTGYTAPILTLTNAGGAYNVSLKGNLSLISGANTATMYQNTGTANITFNGTGTQTISSNAAGNIISGGTVSVTSILGTASGNGNDVQLNSGIYNSGVTFFASGTHYFTAKAGTTLYPPQQSSITNYPTYGHVVTAGSGILQYQGTIGTGGTMTGATVFPVGISTTSYNPVTINNAGTNSVFSVNVANTFTYGVVNASLTSGIQYDIRSLTNPAGMNATVTYQWNLANEPAVFSTQRASLTYGTLVVGHFTGSAWLEYYGTLPGSVMTGGGPYYVSLSGISSFSPSQFGVGVCGAFAANLGCTVLPVDLLSFSGKANGSISQLVWKTTREVNVKEFTVERGLDGIHFGGIGNVAAKNTSGQNEYGFDDRLVPAASIVYYRLKIMSKDGQYKYSQVVALNFKKGTVQVFPNPVHNSLFITHDKAGAGASVGVFTSTGNKIAEYPVVAGTMQTTVNTTSLPAGAYSLRYQNNGMVQIVRFAKL